MAALRALPYSVAEIEQLEQPLPIARADEQLMDL